MGFRVCLDRDCPGLMQLLVRVFCRFGKALTGMIGGFVRLQAYCKLQTKPKTPKTASRATSTMNASTAATMMLTAVAIMPSTRKSYGSHCCVMLETVNPHGSNP